MVNNSTIINKKNNHLVPQTIKHRKNHESQWLSPVSSTSKHHHRDITEILLKYYFVLTSAIVHTIILIIVSYFLLNYKDLVLSVFVSCIVTASLQKRAGLGPYVWILVYMLEYVVNKITKTKNISLSKQYKNPIGKS
jgi:predicted PurR-regulated permease PerM